MTGMGPSCGSDFTDMVGLAGLLIAMNCMCNVERV